MKRSLLLLAVAAVWMLVSAQSALAQRSSSVGRSSSSTSNSSNSSNSSSSNDTRAPIPQDTRAPLPGDTRSGGGSQQRNDQPAQRDRPDRAPPAGRDNPPRDGERARDRDDRDRPLRPYPPYYYRRPYYEQVYDPPGYYEPPYDDYRRRPSLDEPVPAGDDGRARDDADRGPAPGTLRLPPDELLGDQDVSPALRKALDASPQYKEATAQLIKAWTAYAEAAERVLSAAHKTPRYKRALADLQRAEAGMAAIKSNVAQADKLVSAAQAVIDARKSLRDQEEAALAADGNVQRLKKQLDQAVERRNRIRKDIEAKLAQR